MLSRRWSLDRVGTRVKVWVMVMVSNSVRIKVWVMVSNHVITLSIASRVATIIRCAFGMPNLQPSPNPWLISAKTRLESLPFCLLFSKNRKVACFSLIKYYYENWEVLVGFKFLLVLSISYESRNSLLRYLFAFFSEVSFTYSAHS